MVMMPKASGTARTQTAELKRTVLNLEGESIRADAAGKLSATLTLAPWAIACIAQKPW
jgi:hypothetical protein